jgi:hypothetical protein
MKVSTKKPKTIVIWESEWENKKELIKEQLKYEIIEKRNK